MYNFNLLMGTFQNRSNINGFIIEARIGKKYFKEGIDGVVSIRYRHGFEDGSISLHQVTEEQKSMEVLCNDSFKPIIRLICICTYGKAYKEEVELHMDPKGQLIQINLVPRWVKDNGKEIFYPLFHGRVSMYRTIERSSTFLNIMVKEPAIKETTPDSLIW